MNSDEPRWREIPVLRVLHEPWWRARGGRLGESARPYSSDWERLLEEAGLVSAELRTEAERDARLLAAAGLLRLRSPKYRPHLIDRVLVPVDAERRLARLFGDPLEPDAPGVSLAGVAWEPELAFVREERIGVAPEDLLALNAFLAEGGRNRPEVPIKERSVQIFGDEKRLDALVATALFRPGRLSLATLRSRLVPEPLGWHRGSCPTGPVLVLENAATWDSYRRWDERSPRFAAVIYGRGLSFVDAVGGVSEIFREVGGVRPIEYFGDLDPAGLEIPWRASRRAEAGGLPVVRPHGWSYRRLLELGAGREGPWDGEPVREEALHWLGESAALARDLFVRRRRIAQEHLGWEVLSALV